MPTQNLSCKLCAKIRNVYITAVHPKNISIYHFYSAAFSFSFIRIFRINAKILIVGKLSIKS